MRPAGHCSARSSVGSAGVNLTLLLLLAHAPEGADSRFERFLSHPPVFGTPPLIPYGSSVSLTYLGSSAIP